MLLFHSPEGSRPPPIAASSTNTVATPISTVSSGEAPYTIPCICTLPPSKLTS